MKSLTKITLLLLLLIGAPHAFSQNYPADPSIGQIIAKLKTDKGLPATLESYGYDPSVLQRGTFRFAKKSELKDYFNVRWYWRSDYAYKISLNKNYRDMRNFAIFLETPKDAQGISHKIFIKVTYTRRTEQDFEDTKWNYYYANVDPVECEAYGLPELTDEERKQLMMDYIGKNKDTDKGFQQKQHPIHHIVKVDSVHAFSHDPGYFKPMSALRFLWTLTVLGEYSINETESGGTERIGRDYLNIPFEVTYSNGKYEMQSLTLGYIQGYRDTDAPAFNALYNSGYLYDKRLEDPVWYDNLKTKGFEALMKQKYTRDQPAGSEAFIKKRMDALVAVLEKLDEMDEKAVKTVLKPFMNPAKADELASSYATLLEGFRAKLCTLEVVRTQGSIPYAYGFGDTTGPKVDFGMSVKREAARTKELKKAYKAGGMSGAVLKSTSRGSEYGKLSNKSYRQTFKLVLIDNNWYIDEAAELDQVKIKF